MRPIRVLKALACASVVLATASSARADQTQDCDAAYRQTQIARREGKLLEARRQALVCGATACPNPDKIACKPWLAEIEVSMPTVVFSAQDAFGADTFGVRLLVDGQVVVETLDGRPVPLDPGPHKVRFEKAGADAIEQDILIRQGEKERHVAVSFKRQEAAPPALGPIATSTRTAESSTPSEAPPLASTLPGGTAIPKWAWGVGGAGLALSVVGGVFIGLAVDGQAKINLGTCGACTAQVAQTKLYQGLAGAFGGAGILALGAGIIGIAMAPKTKAQALRLAPAITMNGAGASMRGSF